METISTLNKRKLNPQLRSIKKWAFLIPQLAHPCPAIKV